MKKENSTLARQFDKPTANKNKGNIKEYINNPFMITIKGLEWMFNRAKGIAIVLLVLSLIGAAGNYAVRGMQVSDLEQKQQITQHDQGKAVHEFTQIIQAVSPEKWAIIAIFALLVALVVIFISFWLKGAADFAAARLAKGKSVTLGEALTSSWQRLGSYAWVQVIVGVKIFLWSLLLIVPGIIMAVRYSLAGTAFFAEDLKGNAAVKRSLALTKNAWLTTFGTHAVFNIVTFGLVAGLTGIANNSVLYSQFAKAGEQKPKPHWLSVLALVFLLVIIVIILLAALALIAFAVVNHNQTY